MSKQKHTEDGRKICHKGGCIEGEDKGKLGIVAFTSGTKYCDRCYEYNKRKLGPKGVADTYRKRYNVPDKIIYGIFKKDKLVYIGESNKAPKRLYDHFHTKCGRSCMDHLEVEDRKNHSYKILWDGTDHSKQDRLMLEAVLIQSLRPKYNKQWNQKD